jgi:tRNA threonylcarbamoyladenosine biosynthesis protein TsaE
MTMPVVLTIADPDAMARLGARLAGQLLAGDAVLLTGELGAGKTTLTRGIGAALGVRGAVTSPTFVLARTHLRTTPGTSALSATAPLVHVDAYRLGDAAELDDLDIDFAASIVVVEWGAGMLEQLVDSWLAVTIDRPTGAASGTTARATDSTVDSTADSADEAPIEPRTVTIVGFGDRWVDLGWLHAAGD